MGEGTRREREGAGRAPDRDTQAGVEKVVSPPPSGKRRGRRLPSSWVRDRLGGSMTRPVGTATWVRGRGGGGRSADVMDGLRGPGGRGAPVFRAVLVARRDWPEPQCSRSPRRPPFHILQRRRGQPRKQLFTRLAGGSALCSVTLGPRLPGEAPSGAWPISAGEGEDRGVTCALASS